ncbi:hypothetical protein FNV43_RR00493 [Rhamnella rubrinervis]|uniref:Uncharacterized protein n=1 Tax=Rhamnella rubrinervis TaxID=2594499 RepID=A0A8K0HMX5_9ROSA|nr:hypothetical protein FNV43_RR00493 [Rhamnella rubrinervis]
MPSLGHFRSLCSLESEGFSGIHTPKLIPGSEQRTFTYRHLCEFIGLDDEIAIKKNCFEYVFDSLNKDREKELEAVGRQYPFEPLKAFVICAVPVKYSKPYILRKDAGHEDDN